MPTVLESPGNASESLIHRCGFGSNPSIRAKRSCSNEKLGSKGSKRALNKASSPHVLYYFYLNYCNVCAQIRGLVKEEKIKGNGRF